MCKNNFTNENEFDFSDYLGPYIPRPDYKGCNPSGPLNFDLWLIYWHDN